MICVGDTFNKNLVINIEIGSDGDKSLNLVTDKWYPLFIKRHQEIFHFYHNLTKN